MKRNFDSLKKKRFISKNNLIKLKLKIKGSRVKSWSPFIYVILKGVEYRECYVNMI